MSDGVVKTKRVRMENNASIHQVQLHGRDIKLRQVSEQSSSSFRIFFFSLIKGFFFYLAGRDSVKQIRKIWMKT